MFHLQEIIFVNINFFGFLEKIPTRVIIGLSLFFGEFFLNTARSNFPIILLAMVEPLPNENGTIIPLPDVS